VQQRELTKRQKEFLAKSAQGMTSGKIAGVFCVSDNTVRSTFAAAKERLGAKTTVQAVVLAIAREELGLQHDGFCYMPEIEEK
jgi:DNA-binding CsgD family transcriptional regulator